jgi:hypothetical protein
MKRQRSISSAGAVDLQVGSAASNNTKQSNSSAVAAVQQQQQQMECDAIDAGGCLSLLAEVAAQVSRGVSRAASLVVAADRI